MKGIQGEIIVVDNNSVDGSLKMLKEKFPTVTLISNIKNLGFSKANNQAIKIAKGSYILLLNPDTLVEIDTFRKIIEFADRTPDAGGIGVKMIDGKGKFLPESKRSLPTPSVAFYKIFGLARLFPKSQKFGKYHLTFLSENDTHKVDVLSGAFMFIRKEVLDKIGMLDETFFMYGEDIDLSYRISKAGYNNYYFPQTRIIHYKGESTKKSSVNYVFVFYKAMIIFAQKHFTKKRANTFSLLINMAIYFRASLALFMRFFKRISLPLIDSILLFSGMIVIKHLWQNLMLEHAFDYYPKIFISLVVPIYIAIWLFSVYFNGGYERPVNIRKIIQGLFIGTLLILVIYALLPESFRFSRALILLGSVWAIISMCLTRVFFHVLRLKDFRIGLPSKRIAIIGDKEESQRVGLLFNQFTNMPEFIGNVSYSTSEGEIDNGNNAIGHFSQLNDIIDIYKINELVFCAKDIPYTQIIDKMSELQNSFVDFKIIPPEGLFLVGSNSIEAPENLWSININTISKTVNIRKKNLLDFFVSIFFLGTYPFLFFINKNKLNLLHNILTVLTLKKTWVGYSKFISEGKLPKLKNGILTPLDNFNLKNLDNDLSQKINLMYARNYKASNDILIIFKNLNKLDRDNTENV